MSKRRRFIQCDVFTSKPTKGNALAVVLDGEGLSEQQMQEFAAWTNLAETTFIFSPDDPSADYRVRIFTPLREMPFAGHPTLGSCAAWLANGGIPKQSDLVRQECSVGIVEINITENPPAFRAPPTQIHKMPAQRCKELADSLQLDTARIKRSALLDNGPQWQVFEMLSAEDVLAVDSSKVNWHEHKPIGLIGPHRAGTECDYEVRMLAPSSGMSEDPITGSLNAALAHWMLSTGELSKSVVVAQGTCINRFGRVFIQPHINGKDVFIGGQTHILIEGSVFI